MQMSLQKPAFCQVQPPDFPPLPYMIEFPQWLPGVTANISRYYPCLRRQRKGVSEQQYTYCMLSSELSSFQKPPEQQDVYSQKQMSFLSNSVLEVHMRYLTKLYQIRGQLFPVGMLSPSNHLQKNYKNPSYAVLLLAHKSSYVGTANSLNNLALLYCAKCRVDIFVSSLPHPLNRIPSNSSLIIQVLFW